MIAPTHKTRQEVRCAVYTRKSVTEGLDMDFNTLDAQREAGEAYITSQKGNGWQCLETRYDDGGFTGGNLEHPALDQLLRDIEAGLIDCVVVYKVDRLSRSLFDFSRLVEVFDKHGVSFVSVTQPINTADSTGRLMLNILLSFAQFEREQIADRTRDKVRAARRRGKWTGGPPMLGYDVHPEGGKLVVNEDEAPQIREIFRLYLKHRSLQKVVAELKRRGWTTKTWTTKMGRVHEGKPISKSYLSRLLGNPLYIGCVSHQGQVYPGEHRGIIRKATFDQAQEILAANLANGPGRKKNKYGHLLKGLIRCSACGTAYVPTTSKKGNTVYRYYTCSGAQKNGWKTCPHANIAADNLERLVVEQIKVIGSDSGLQAEVLRQAKKTVREKRNQLAAEVRRAESKLAEIDQEKSGLLKALAGRQVNGTEVSGRMAKLEENAARVATRLTEVKRDLEALDEIDLDPAALKEALALFDPVWDVLLPEEQARIIELLVDRIEYNGDAGSLAISFHPTGIKALAEEVNS